MIPEILNSDFTIIDLVKTEKGIEYYTGIKPGSSTKVLITVDRMKDPYTYMEAKIMRELSGEEGIPKLLKYGKCDACFFSVTETVGKSLEQLKEDLGGKITTKAALSLGVQILHLLERLHFRGYVHRNLHPQNICISASKKGLVFRDLRYAKRIVPENTDKNHKWVGAPAFASLNNHLRYSLSRRDDLESLAYILVYCLKGLLPWGKLASGVNIHEWHKSYILKANMSISDLCSECPKSLVDFLTYSRNLRFEQSPDYEYLKALLQLDEPCYNIRQCIKYGSFRVNAPKAFARNKSYRKKQKSTVSEVTDIGNYPTVKNREIFNTFAKLPKPLGNKTCIVFCV